MPIDTSIYQLLGHNVPQVDVAGSMSKGLQLRQLVQQKQDDQTMRDLSRQAGGNLGQLADLAQGKGLYKQAQDIRSKQLAQQKEIAQIQETLGKVDAQHRAAVDAGNADVAKMAAWADTPEKWNQGIQVVLRDHPILANGLQPFMQYSPENRAAVMTKAQTVQAALDSLKPKIEERNGAMVPVTTNVLGQQTVGAPVAVKAQSEVAKINQDAANKAMTPEQATSAVNKATGNVLEGFHGAIGPNGQPGIFQLKPATGEVRQIPGLKPIPPAATVLNLPTPATPPTFEKDATKPWREHPGFQTVVQKQPALAPFVDQYLNGDYKIGSGRGVVMDRQVQALAAQIDSNVTQHDYDLKQKALADPKVEHSNAAIGHIGDFKRLLSQLDPQTQAEVLNTPWNKILTKFSDSPQAGIISALHTTGLSLSEEYGKALGGSDALEASKRRQEVFNPDKPIGQLNSNLSAVGHLMNQTIGAKENILNRNNPNRVPLSLLDPSAQEVLQGLGINHARGGREKQAPTQPPTKVNPADGKTYYLHSDGKYYSTKG